MTTPFSRIRAAAVDGRLCNVYWRQGQLENLHAALISHSHEIRDAIRQDTGNTASEARIEYLLALSAIKELYSSLDPAKELRDEYSTANGIDSPLARQPAGLAYIDPASYSMFYSVLSPLAAAIAAGNCVIVRIQNDTRETTRLLKRLLPLALDNDILHIVQRGASDSDLPTGAIRVFQESTQETVKPTDLISPSASRTIAIVDRTADLDSAAKALVAARFGFGGKSPYAPDVTLVNDYMMGEFLKAVVQHSLHYQAQPNATSDTPKVYKRMPAHDSGLLGELQKTEDSRLICSDRRGTVVELTQRSSSLLQRKISEPVLVVHAVTSLDDAIDFANSNSTLLAAYHFADNASCKYLGQFIDSQVAFANHIPADILVGPAAPLGHPVATDFRYHPALFTVPRPRYVNCRPLSILIGATVSGQESQEELAKWDVDARNLAVDTKRPTGEMLGFFEQGIVTGASLLLTIILAGVGLAAYHGT